MSVATIDSPNQTLQSDTAIDRVGLVTPELLTAYTIPNNQLDNVYGFAEIFDGVLSKTFTLEDDQTAAIDAYHFEAILFRFNRITDRTLNRCQVHTNSFVLTRYREESVVVRSILRQCKGQTDGLAPRWKAISILDPQAQQLAGEYHLFNRNHDHVLTAQHPRISVLGQQDYDTINVCASSLSHGTSKFILKEIVKA